MYPDVIESAGAAFGKAHVIKSHLNVGRLPEYVQLQLIEPLRDLFKDEVRKIGVELGLPFEMVCRHPFPGPGLGVGILGEVSKSYAGICGKQTISTSKSCAQRIFTTKLVRLSPCFYRPNRSVWWVMLGVTSILFLFAPLKRWIS